MAINEQKARLAAVVAERTLERLQGAERAVIRARAALIPGSPVLVLPDGMTLPAFIDETARELVAASAAHAAAVTALDRALGIIVLRRPGDVSGTAHAG